MTTPKVSIVVPVYNTEKYLTRCLESIKKQTLTEIEIIIVDDGSKENCSALCDKLASEDRRIKVIHKENQGLGYARNTGLDAASGEYVGFVDSDDYIEPEMYESMYNTASKNNSDLVVSGICFVGGNTFGKDGEYVKKTYFDTDTLFQGKESMKNLMLGVAGALPHEKDDSRYGASVCKNLFRLSVIKENNLKFLSEREILSEDTLFMIDYIQSSNKAVGINRADYCYCRNGESLSKSYNSTRFEKSLIFLKELEKKVAVTATKNEYGIYLDRLTQGFGRVLCSQEIVHARDNKIGYGILKRRLKEICTQKEIAHVLKSYPWYKLPVKQAVFAFTMKYKLFLMQKIIVTLRDR